MHRQASVAVLSADENLAAFTAQVLTSHSPTAITLLDVNSLGKSSPNTPAPSSAVTTHVFLPVRHSDFQPPHMGAFINWGANCTLLVIDSSQGIDSTTVSLMLVAMRHHPAIIAVTGLDNARSHFDETVAVCQRVFGTDRQIVALSLPVLDESESVQGTLNLLTETIQWRNAAGHFEEHDLDAEHYELIDTRFDELTNALAITTENDAFAHELLEGSSLDAQILHSELLGAIRSLELIPVMPISGDVGLTELIALLQEVGVDIPNEWSPFSPSYPDEPIASVIADGMVRVWHGNLTAGDFMFEDQPGQVTSLATIGGGAISHATCSSIYRANLVPDCEPGTTISISGSALTIPEESP